MFNKNNNKTIDYNMFTKQNKELMKDMYLVLEYLNYDIGEWDVMIRSIKREIKIKKLLQK